MGVIDRIKALCRNFLWEGVENHSKAPLVAWSTLCKGKKYGGLGLIDTKQWNIAAVGKLVWWIAKKKDHLWIQWVDKVYIKQLMWMEYKPTANSSWAWRKICEVKEIFKNAYQQGKWMADGDEYTISAGYTWLTQDSTPEVTWFKSVWNKFIVPKHAFILWLLKQERLLTLDRLAKMGITQNTTCYICGEKPETHVHLFQECQYAKICYAKLFEWLRIQHYGQVTVDRMLKVRKYTSFIRLLLSSLVAAVQYQIWLRRNKCWQEGYLLHPSLIIAQVKNGCKLRLMHISVGKLKRDEIKWCQERELM